MLKIVSIISILLFSTKAFSFDYTKSVEIERIGEFKLLDSLIDYVDKDYIKQEIINTRDMYLRFTDEFGEVRILSEDSTFYQYNFFVKKDDPKFLIHSIRAFRRLPYGLCTKLHGDIVEMLDQKYPTDDQSTGYYEISFVKEPILENTRYYENSEMSVKCYDYIDPEYPDNLSIKVSTIEKAYWMREDLAN